MILIILSLVVPHREVSSDRARKSDKRAIAGGSKVISKDWFSISFVDISSECLSSAN
jgi:hypothetical protein